VNGIDFLEVSPDQTSLAVTFVRDLGLASLAVANVAIDGGVRITGILVTAVSAAGAVLTVTVDRPGDFSTYTLRLRASPDDDTPPAGFDPRLASVDFSFKASCPNDFDCETEVECPQEFAPVEFDYLAKDYTSFRQLMLDRMALLVPQWTERHPADATVALVELLAYVGDQISYFQDSVATEAYLGTARRRPSLRRHARLLDYQAHAGCNARVWVAFDVSATVDLQARTVLLTGNPGAAAMVDPTDLDAALKTGPVVFETIYGRRLLAAHTAVDLYTWSDDQCCLVTGATRATLTDTDPRSLDLAAGDVIVFEEVRDPETGLPHADPVPSRTHPVRLTSVTPTADPVPSPAVNVIEIEWAADDALPFPLCVSALVHPPDGSETLQGAISVARCNVVLADHGLSVPAEPLAPDVVPDPGARNRPYRPRFPRSPVTFAAPVDLAGSAAASALNDPRAALPAATLAGQNLVWEPVWDLLGSGRFDPAYVVEVENDGTAGIRFGDDEHGRRPDGGFSFTAQYRVGNGTAGNVGAGSIRQVVLTGTGVNRVWNPLSAVGGTEPEPLEQIRLAAPAAFRFQERAVTEADYATVTEQEPTVQKAAARFRWTGSWYTAFVAADRTNGLPEDPAFVAATTAHLDGYRMAGHDLDVERPSTVPLDVALDVCVARGFFTTDVEATLLRELGTVTLPDGRLGFFHPDNFTFGTPVYLSRIFARVTAVPGVRWVQATRFQRYGKAPNGELAAEEIAAGPREIVRLDNDPNFPENGKLQLTMQGGV